MQLTVPLTSCPYFIKSPIPPKVARCNFLVFQRRIDKQTYANFFFKKKTTYLYLPKP